MIKNILKLILFFLIALLFIFTLFFLVFPIDEITIENSVVFLSVLTILSLSIVFVVIIILRKRLNPLKELKSCIIFMLFFFTIISCIAFHTYKTTQSFTDARDTSLITKTYYVDDKYIKFLPYYDYFYNKGGEDAFYGFSVDKMNNCSYVRIDNKGYILKPNTTSYVAKCLKSSNLFLKMKCKFDDYLLIVKEGFIKEREFSLDKNTLEIYQSNYSYFAEINTDFGIVSIKLEFVDKGDITMEQFIKDVIRQSEIIADDFYSLERIEDKRRMLIEKIQ